MVANNQHEPANQFNATNNGNREHNTATAKFESQHTTSAMVANNTAHGKYDTSDESEKTTDDDAFSETLVDSYTGKS
jgi:hypothetical protein